MKTAKAEGLALRAAIYARKSNDDNDRDAENKSVARQVELARAYAARKGWTVDDEHIFTDDGVSGAEFEHRPGFARLLASLPKRNSRQAAPFGALVMAELSRLGRDTHRTPFYCAEILDAGVRIWTYLNDSEEKGDSPEARLMTSVRAYSDEAYRIRTAERVRSSLARMAEKGYVTGGLVFGFDNVEVFATAVNGERVRTHSEYRVNPEQAAVVRTIFRMYADGFGFATIAKALNADPRERYAALSLRYFKGQRVAGPRQGAGDWASSSVREILHRERYVGRLRYGRMRNDWKRGTKHRRPGAESDVIRVERENLRIVPRELWDEVQARLGAAKKVYLRDNAGKLWGRPGAGVESRFLLSGLGQCSSCGHNITMVGGLPSAAHRRAIYYYGCSWFQNKGSSICANDQRARMERADALVLGEVRRTLLTPDAVDCVIALAESKIEEAQRSGTERPERIEVELRKLQRQRENLIAAVADGRAPASVLDRIRELDGLIVNLERRLAEQSVEAPSEIERARLRKELRGMIGEFDELLSGDVPLARQVLRKFLDGPIIFDASSGNYVLSGRSKVGALFSKAYIQVVPRKGLEPPQCCHR